MTNSNHQQDDFSSIRNQGLQAIRGFAAISVMLFHGSQIIKEHTGYSEPEVLFNQGYLGVDIFFVLSGFIIAYTRAKKKEQALIFLSKRISRIFPSYWIATSLLILGYTLFPQHDQPFKTDSSIILGSFMLLPQPRYVLGVAWTLYYEMIFYTWCSITRDLSSMWTSGLAWSGLILGALAFDVKTSLYWVNSLLNPVILEFFLGFITARAFCNLSLSSNQGRIIMFLGFLSLSITVLATKLLHIYPPETNAQDTTRIIFFGLPSAIIVFGAAYWNNHRVGLLSRIGDSSYSLYLIHGTIISTMMIILERFQLKTIAFKNEFLSGTTSAAIFMATILAAFLFANLLERPSSRMARRVILKHLL